MQDPYPPLRKPVRDHRAPETPLDRNRHLLAGLTKASKVIEIGPAHNPLVPRSAGWNSFTLDHATRADLIAKYAGDPMVDPERIEEVDFVWHSGSLTDAVPPEHHGTFDAFIASHVIEHTTDVVRFLQFARTLLQPQGAVLLAVPDKRKCFDFYRNPSTTADAIVAYEERRDRHDVRTHLDYGLRIAKKGGFPAWFDNDTRPAELLSGLEVAWQMLGYRDVPEYLDVHNWVFVPSSFELMVLELGHLGFLDLRVESLTEMPDTEFLVRLRPGRETVDPDALQPRRRGLLERTLIELADQTRQIPGSPLSVPPPASSRPAPRFRWRRWLAARV